VSIGTLTQYTSHFYFLSNSSATLFTIQLGLSNLKANEPSTLTLATDEYFLHPEFNPNTLENDIGLIKFRMPITFTGTYKIRITFNYKSPNCRLHQTN
jgi:hypothetical protein